MPTGAGKSICYQVPALLLPGVTLVISPLISLMQDQVEALTQAGVRAAYLNSTLTPAQYARALQNAESGAYKIIYAAPERLSTEGFRAVCARLKISLVAVDEAHCVSQWGQDFRPDYLRIAEFVASLSERPVVGAFTATATKAVRADMAALLELREPVRVTTGFDRPNLYFGVQAPHSKQLALLALLEERREKCGIVYCATRKAVEEVEALLRDKGFAATRYHAGLSEDERRRNQEDFVFDRRSVMVATNAFGMGIDKSNVAFVIHYNMPKNLESYYQEAGRAGRDGSPADCILLYSPQDVRTNRFLIENSEPNAELDAEMQETVQKREYDRLRQMTFYCTTADCLRAFILRYFGEQAGEYCGNCSSCAAGSAVIDATVPAQQVLSCVARTGQRFGRAMIADVLRGSENERVLRAGLEKQSTYGLMREKKDWEVRRLLDALLVQGVLVQTEGQYPTLRLAGFCSASRNSRCACRWRPKGRRLRRPGLRRRTPRCSPCSKSCAARSRRRPACPPTLCLQTPPCATCARKSRRPNRNFCRFRAWASARPRATGRCFSRRSGATSKSNRYRRTARAAFRAPFSRGGRCSCARCAAFSPPRAARAGAGRKGRSAAR